VKRHNLPFILGILIAGGALVTARSGRAAEADEKPAAKPAAADADEEKTTITRDADGNPVIHMSDDTQGDAGILVKLPVTGQWSPEVKGYGRVMDPAPLAELLTSLATSEAEWTVSSNELARQKMLAEQGNSSQRALQTAEAAALHDQLATDSARSHLAMSAGQAVASRADLPAFVSSLTSLKSALVRIDLPAGGALEKSPTGARLVTLSGQSADGACLGPATGVDSQTQGRGYLFLLETNALQLSPGEALTGYLKLPGEPLTGLIIPREAVVRAEGKGWIYEMSEGSDAFTRKEITLDRPTADGWFVTNGVTAGKYVVTTGAQTLLSEEMKAAISPD
jgi:hypothetical protein